MRFEYERKKAEMEKQKLITIEKYAAMHRESIHSVIKKTMRGELQTKVEEEEGKKITYIVVSDIDDTRAPAKEETPQQPSEEIDYKAAFEALQKEMQALKERVEKSE